MDSIHQAKVKSGHLLHKMALVQSQRNRTVGIQHYKISSYLHKEMRKKLVISPSHSAIEDASHGEGNFK